MEQSSVKPQFESSADVIAALDKEKVGYIRLLFTDVLGHMKGMTMTRSEIEGVLEEGQGFDGSSIQGYVRIEESDLMARPDISTFRIVPWDVSDEKVALMFCRIENPDGSPFEGDPRNTLDRMLARIAKDGWTFNCGPEIEFFYFRDSSGTELLDHDGYFDYSTVDEGARLRKKAVVALQQLGIQVECSHHEVAPSQHEIDLRYQPALTMADFAMLYRFVVRETALQGGAFASFMPKPIFGQNGSGMHTHMSLFKDGRNLFFDESDTEFHLSTMARQFIAGILKHIPEMTLVLNQWFNSYKRLVDGYEAPVYVSWGRRNRSSLVRVPQYRVGKEKATRIELRSPDPACNPYLAFTVMLAAGLKGIDEGYELAEPVEQNIFHMDESERAKLGIKSLPSSLAEAINLFEASSLMRDVLGKHIFTSLIANKRAEQDKFRTRITDVELAEYLPIL
ncbi:MAG TPA: glutamine synthetase [Candidatus Kerfeldbacteria bacterium]|nr:MAG: Glutamine synthase [Parcubacteria group bacterium GW2011_GWA2_48_9]KKW15192.1 MAG: Glutamine synthase [Parcubacteria group bacterium GW2011_GWC2_49_9]HCM68480.1 glutamine synthetase [Candidatus Kerfeldbacteria bacterium]